MLNLTLDFSQLVENYSDLDRTDANSIFHLLREHKYLDESQIRQLKAILLIRARELYEDPFGESTSDYLYSVDIGQIYDEERAPPYSKYLNETDLAIYKANVAYLHSFDELGFRDSIQVWESIADRLQDIYNIVAKEDYTFVWENDEDGEYIEIQQCFLSTIISVLKSFYKKE